MHHIQEVFRPKIYISGFNAIAKNLTLLISLIIPSTHLRMVVVVLCCEECFPSALIGNLVKAEGKKE